jgi:hypothetical protein
MWRLLGNRSATSALVAWLYAPVGLFAAFTVEWTRHDMSPGLWWVLVGLGQLVVVGLLPIVGWLVHRFIPSDRRSLATMLGIVIIVAVRGFITEESTLVFGFTRSFEWSSWLLSLIMQSGLLLLIAGRVSMRKQDEQELRELTGLRDSLLIEEAELGVRVGETGQRLGVQIGLLIEPKRRLIETQLAESERSGDPAIPLETLRTFLDRDLLPLSHRLADTVTPWSSTKSPVGLPERLPKEAMPKTLPARDVIKPGLIAYIVVLLSLASAGGRLPVLNAVMIAIVTTVLIGSMLLGLKFAVAGLRWRTPIALVLATLMVGVVFAAAVRIMLFLTVVQDMRSVLIGGAAGMVFGLLSALAVLVDVRFEMTREDLRRQITALRDSTSLHRQELWLSRRRFGYALHGGLQAALHAAAIRLATAGTGNPQAIAQARADICQAFDRVITDSTDPPVLGAVCSEIAATWQGTCDITWSLPTEVDRALLNYPVTAECSAEVLLEATQNAIRHGNATTVHVDAALHGDRVVLTIVDNGTSNGSTGKHGLGSRMLDEFCSQWSRNPLEFGSRVRAELVLA